MHGLGHFNAALHVAALYRTDTFATAPCYRRRGFTAVASDMLRSSNRAVPQVRGTYHTAVGTGHVKNQNCCWGSFFGSARSTLKSLCKCQPAFLVTVQQYLISCWVSCTGFRMRTRVIFFLRTEVACRPYLRILYVRISPREQEPHKKLGLIFPWK